MSKNSIDLKALIKSGVHFGHETSRWNPKMAPYIWGSKNGIHLIDISKTAYLLEQAAKFLESIAAEGKSILWVGTKKPAQEIVLRAARELNLPFVVNRWVGGTFSNYRQVRKSVANLLQYEDILAKADEFLYRKKELNTYQKRIDRLIKNVGGIRNLAWPVGAVVVIDVKREHVAIKEALATGIPIVALVDTNSDPSLIDYVIPGNDDAPRSISILVDRLVEGVKKGQEVAASKPQELSAQEIFESVFEVTPGLEEEEEDAAAKRNKGTASGGGASRAKKPAMKPKFHKRAPEGKKFTEEEKLAKEASPKVDEHAAEEPKKATKKAEAQEKSVQTESPEKE